MKYGGTIKDIRRDNLQKLRDGFRTHPEMTSHLPGIEPGFLSQLLRGHRDIGDKLARKIEKGMGKPSGWMDRSHQLEVREISSGYNDRLPDVPLISWVAAGAWADASDPYMPGDGDQMVGVTEKVSSSAFALKVAGDSMEPTFPQGCIIIVDPEVAPENGSFVIVRMEDSCEATFKQLVIDGGKQYLKPVNPRYPIIEINGDATMVGVVKEARLHF